MPVDIDDTTAALFELKSGIAGTLGTSFATPQNSYLRIYGTKGIAETRDDFSKLTWSEGPSSLQDIPIPKENTLTAELQAFSEACSGGSDYAVQLSGAIRNVAVIEAMKESSQQDGQWVFVK